MTTPKKRARKSTRAAKKVGNIRTRAKKKEEKAMAKTRKALAEGDAKGTSTSLTKAGKKVGRLRAKSRNTQSKMMKRASRAASKMKYGGKARKKK